MSNSVINGLKEGHQEIKAVISETQVVSRTYSAAKPKIRQLQDILSAHLGRQDDVFFRKIESMHSARREETKILEFIIHDLKDLKVQFLVFFDKYTGDLIDQGGRTFPKDFAEFSDLILARIRLEEEYLFPLLDVPPRNGT